MPVTPELVAYVKCSPLVVRGIEVALLQAHAVLSTLHPDGLQSLESARVEIREALLDIEAARLVTGGTNGEARRA